MIHLLSLHLSLRIVKYLMMTSDKQCMDKWTVIISSSSSSVTIMLSKVQWIQNCQLWEPQSWTELSDEIKPYFHAMMQTLYKTKCTKRVYWDVDSVIINK